MQITIDNVWAYPESHPRMIGEALTYMEEGARFSKAFKNGYWDGKVCLLKHDKKGWRFPAGLANYVADYLRAFGIEVLLVYTQAPYVIEEVDTFYPDRLVELDSNQEDAIAAVCKEKKGIIKYPTGYGKTRIMGEIVRVLRVPSLILCDRISVAQQLYEDLPEIIGEEVGIISGQGSYIKNCTVGMVQSITGVRVDSLRGFLRGVGLVLIDECHHLVSDTYAMMMEELPNAEYRIGTSATPFKHGGKNSDLKVIGWTGNIIANLSNQEAIDAGRIVPADIYVVSGLESRKTWLNYTQAVRYGIVENKRRNQAIIQLINNLVNNDKQVLVNVDRIDHGISLESQTNTPFVYGGTDNYEREKFLNEFKNGTLHSLIVSKIGDEAINLPNIDVLILAGGGKAPHRQIQRLGRGMRTSDGKDRVTVFDFTEDGKYLKGHYKRRRKLYEDDPAYNIVDLPWEELRKWMMKS